MTAPPRWRKLALTAHITSSVGWIGAVIAFLTLAVAGLNSSDLSAVRASYVAMDLLARFVIVPLAFASLLTGLVSSLTSPWGLLRHYWVLIKLAVTAVATGVLLLQMEPIGELASVAADGNLAAAELRAARRSLVAHAGGGLFVLLIPTVLAVYKPRGLTRRGWRKQKEQQSGPRSA